MSSAQPGPAGPSGKGPSPVVLVVDDEPSVLALLAVALPSLGLRARQAAGGRQALEQLHLHSDVSLVLSDVDMPALDGLELLAEVRRGGPALPVCLMTGGRHDRGDLLALGAASVIEKPFCLSQLASTLWRVLGWSPD